MNTHAVEIVNHTDGTVEIVCPICGFWKRQLPGQKWQVLDRGDSRVLHSGDKGLKLTHAEVDETNRLEVFEKFLDGPK